MPARDRGDRPRAGGMGAGMAALEARTGTARSATRRGGRFARPGTEDAAEALVRQAVARAKDGDAAAVRYLYVRYAGEVEAYVRAIVRDAHEAEDITQNVFAKLVPSLRHYEEQSVPFAGWILRVARNAAFDNMRQRRAVPYEDVRSIDSRQVEGVFSDSG